MGRLVERLWRCYFWYWFLFFWLVTYLINKNSVCKQSPTWCVPLPCYLSLLVFRWIVKYRRCSGWKLRQTDRGKWSEHPITFRFLSHVCPDVKVIDIQSDLSRKRPRPVGDHFLKAKKISQSKLYSWGLLQTTTARKRPLPLWGWWFCYYSLLFVTSLSDHLISVSQCCIYRATQIMRRMFSDNMNYKHHNFEIARSKFCS